jgi:hypothetical protein
MSTKTLPELCELIRISWTRPFAEVRPVLNAFCHGLSDIPGALRSFDEVRTYASPVLTHLGQLLELYQYEAPRPADDTRDASALRRVIIDFLDGAPIHNYAKLRAPLLEFCIREAIAPEAVLALSSECPEPWRTYVNGISEALQQDVALRCIFLGQYATWL